MATTTRDHDRDRDPRRHLRPVRRDHRGDDRGEHLEELHHHRLHDRYQRDDDDHPDGGE